MTVVSSTRDSQALTLTIVAEVDATVERGWQVWEDPRQLERWWGPPSWPARFEQHDFAVGGQCRYYMTGPDGQKSHGWWTITAVDAPHRLEFDDGFADEKGEPVGPLEPTHVVVTLEAIESGTRMTITSKFADEKQLESLLAMGMEEGMRSALEQIDPLVAGTSR